MIELYDEKYVYFDWKNELKGKKGFVATDILNIKKQVNKCTDTILIYHSSSNTQPFTTGYYNYPFAYYDPHYEMKVAFNEGKTIQIRSCGKWENVPSDEIPFVFSIQNAKLRIKPEEEYIVLLDDIPLNEKQKIKPKFTVYHEDVIKGYVRHRNVYFKGTYDDCKAWIKRRSKHDVKVAYEWEFKNKHVMYSVKNHNDWKYSGGICDFDYYDYILYEEFDSENEIKNDDRILTYKELAEWLAKGNGQFWDKFREYISYSFDYDSDKDDNIVSEDYILIRRWGDKWHKPTVSYCME